MICRNCGNTLPDGSFACNACGAGFGPAYNSNEVNNIAFPQRNNNTQPKQYISVGGWIARWLLACIPVIGWIVYFVFLIVWANRDCYETSFRNWAKAQIWIIVFMAIIALLVILALM